MAFNQSNTEVVRFNIDDVVMRATRDPQFLSATKKLKTHRFESTSQALNVLASHGWVVRSTMVLRGRNGDERHYLMARPMDYILPLTPWLEEGSRDRSGSGNPRSSRHLAACACSARMCFCNSAGGPTSWRAQAAPVNVGWSLGEGSVFAALLVLGLMRLERNFRQERMRLARERNLLLGVTHELKTPLASVQLGVDSLRRLKLSEEDRAAVLENMQSGVQDLGYRVEEMLVATRLQRQTDVQASTFDWSDMLDEAVGRVADVQRDRIQVHRIEGPQEVRGDRALWVLSASNLIENALKYSQGAVGVRAGHRVRRGAGSV